MELDQITKELWDSVTIVTLGFSLLGAVVYRLRNYMKAPEFFKGVLAAVLTSLAINFLISTFYEFSLKVWGGVSFVTGLYSKSLYNEGSFLIKGININIKSWFQNKFFPTQTKYQPSENEPDKNFSILDDEKQAYSDIIEQDEKAN